MIRRKEKERKQLYDRIFSSEDGQRLLKDLAQRNHVFDVITVPEPSTSAFRDGRRSVVVDIINYLNLNLRDMERLGRESNGRDTEQHDID